MAQESLRRHFSVPAAPEIVWVKLMDVARVASWLSILHSVTERDPLVAYDAVLQDRVGPFALKADVTIDVVEVVELKRIAVRATGEDRQVHSRIVIEAAVDLNRLDDAATEITVSGTYEITGRVATFGAGTIRNKARRLTDDFCASAQTGLA